MSDNLKDKRTIIGGDKDNNLMVGSVEKSTRISIGSSLTSASSTSGSGFESSTSFGSGFSTLGSL